MKTTNSCDSTIIERIAKQAGHLGIELADITGAIEELSAHVTAQAADFGQLQDSSREIAVYGSEIAGIAGTARSVVANARHTSEQKA